jgi:plasmid maintenance system antidote protein VapI
MNNLKTWLTHKNMTQGELAEALGYSRIYIHLIVNGKRPITPAFEWKFYKRFGGAEQRAAFSKE